jgi:hypothetical protein
MTTDPAIEHLGRSWQDAQAAGQEYRDAADAAVMRWAWGPNFAGWERLEPLFVQRAHGMRPTTRELAEPEDRTTRDLFGFDAAGRVVVARQFQNWPTVGVRREQVLAEGQVGPVQLWFERAELYRIGVPAFEGGRITEMAWHSYDVRDGFGGYRERYAYEGGRLAVVQTEFSDPDRHPTRHEVVWDDDGEVGRIIVDYGDGQHRTTYIRPPKGGIASVRKRVAAELVDRIVAWVARRAPAEPVWALALLYDAEGNPVLPPSLGLAVDAGRDDDPDVMFNPAEWRLMDPEPTEFADEAFAEDCLLLNQSWDAAGNFTAGRRMILEVARELRDRDWDGVLTRAEDFHVYAVDLELEDLERNRRALMRRR